MDLRKKYTISSHLFFGYVVIYFLMMLFAMNVADMSFFGIEFFLYIYFIFFIANKLRLYLKQIKYWEFGLFNPTKIEYFLSGIKTVVAVFIYSTLNIGAWSSVKEKLIEKGFTSLNYILIVNCFLFPIILLVWDIMLISYWSLRKKEEIKGARKKHFKYAENMEKMQNIKKSKELGTMTGYEPKKLGQMILASTPLMKGEPGIGLSGSSFSKQNARAGAIGELNFAKILQLNGYLDTFATYWSVQFPASDKPGPDNKTLADIDCILISNKTVYLIDLKLYSQGNVTWKTTENGKFIYSVDNVTGNFTSQPKKMSNNMKYATMRIKEKLEKLGVKMNVKSYVVMLPSDRGIGKIENVYWPGKIECVSILDFLKIIENEKPFNPENEEAKVLDSVFTWVLKDESGKAPQFDF